MLFFFETKNIGRKPERIAAFQYLADAASEHDMDFDWADETIHAGYGKRWLEALLQTRGVGTDPIAQIREHCGELVAAMVQRAMPEETRSSSTPSSSQRQTSLSSTAPQTSQTR